ncbi:unnamed protein product [Schistosoma haematobium]|nr:unnamed protein product [Schistosoma haematobium]
MDWSCVGGVEKNDLLMSFRSGDGDVALMMARARERDGGMERDSGLNRWDYSFCVRNRMDWSCVGGGEKNDLLMSFRSGDGDVALMMARARERDGGMERDSGLNRWDYSFCVRNRMDWSCVGGGEKNDLLMSFRSGDGGVGLMMASEREMEGGRERESGLNRWDYSFCVRNRMDWSCVGGVEKNDLLMSFRSGDGGVGLMMARERER